MRPCRGCNEDRVVELIDFGRQPLSNRFLRRRDEPEPTFGMTVGQCQSCGLVQLGGDAVPVDALRPRFDWITYAEPEGHLDRMALAIASLPGLAARPSASGVTFKDDSLLWRLRDARVAKTWRVDPEGDLGIDDRRAGLETVQARLDAEAARRIARRRGTSDVVIARHVLEHAGDPRTFLAAVAGLARADGFVYVEVPDCTRGLEHADPTLIWEEHSLYFTPGTFASFLRAAGFEAVMFMRIPHPLDDLLVAVVRRSDSARPLDRGGVAREIERGRAFADGLARKRSSVLGVLASIRERSGPLALFGAGHLGCAFVNLLGLRDSVEFFVDDLEQKRGLFMPGSRLPIRASTALTAERISLCFLSLSPDSEASVVERNRTFIDAGGAFASIFPGVLRGASSPVRSFEAVFAP